MNALCYKIVFSKRLGSLVAVGEHTAGQGKAAGTGIRAGVFPEGAGTAGHAASDNFVGLLKSVFASVALSCVTAGMATAAGPAANTLPTGYKINNGNVAISTTGTTMTINQATDKASVNWQSFSIGSGAAVNVQQNNANSVLLNRVVGNDPSQIFGKLTANGQVILINPNGVVFGKGGSVTASAFTASTFGMTDADFLAGKHKFTRNGSTAGVTVESGAAIDTTGYVALMGASVDNQGAITTKGGPVVLASGESVTLPSALTDNIGVPLSGKVRLELLPSTINAMVANSGTITTEGGQVLMQAAAVSDAVASITHTGTIDTTGVQGGAVTLQADHGIIKATGSIKANSYEAKNKGGDIIIGRDEVTGVLSKSTDVSGAKLESLGGFVETSGEYLETKAVSVKAKDWLLDPTDIKIVDSANANSSVANLSAANASNTDTYQQTGNVNSSEILNTTISSALSNGTNVLIKTTSAGTGNGDITVASNIDVTNGNSTTKNNNATLTLQAERNIVVKAGKSISRSGNNKLGVVLNSDSDGINGGGIVMESSSKIQTNGGNITMGGGTALNGTGYAIADGVNTIQGISLDAATINASGGNIVMNGKTAVNNSAVNLQNVSGIYMSGGSISTTGSGTIDLNGYNQNTDTQSKGFVLANGTITGGSAGAVTITGDSRGVASSTYGSIRGALINGTVTSTGGKINITGYGGVGTRDDNGVDIGGSVIAVGSGAINITGTAGAGGSGGNVGVNTSGATSTISSVDGAIAITGTGGIGNGSQIRDHGVVIGGTNAIKSTGAGNITVTGTVTNNDNGYSRGVEINTGGLNTYSGNIKVDATALLNYQVAAYINAPISSRSGNVYIRSAGANIQNTTNGAISGYNVSIDNTGGTIDTNGVITKSAGGASTWAGVIEQNGIGINGSVTAANNLNMYGNQTGAAKGIQISGATTKVSGKKIQIDGVSNTGNGVLLSGATLSGETINATGTTGGSNGFAMQGGTIETIGTNSTTSTITGNSNAGNTGGAGALQIFFGTNTVKAAAGTKLVLEGNATVPITAPSSSSKERGILVQGGISLSTSGDVTLKGTSNNSDGVSLGGTISELSVNGVTNKLTINGTTNATIGTVKGVNLSGSIANTSINIEGSSGAGEGVYSEAALTANGNVKINADKGAVTLGKLLPTSTTTEIKAATGITITAQEGNLTINQKITNLTSGDIVLGAGVSKNMNHTGDGSGGDVKTSTGNTVTNYAGGKTYIYTGTTAGTGALSNLSRSTMPIDWKLSGASQNADSNVAYPSSVSTPLGISGSNATTQVMFREKVAMELANGATVTRTYGYTNTKNDSSKKTALWSEVQNALGVANNSTITKTTNAGTFQISGAALANDLSEAFLSTTSYSGSGYLNVTASDYTYGALSGNKYATTLKNTEAVKVVISKANLTKVTASKTYDGLQTVKATEVTAIEGVNGETFTANSGTAAISGKNVAGTKTVTDLTNLGLTGVGGGDTGNYNLSSGLPAQGATTNNVVIGKATLAMAMSDQAKRYDGNTSATLLSNAITAKGVTVAGQTESAAVNQTVAAYNNKNVTDATNVTANLGTANFTAATGTDLNNYNLPTSVTGKGTITPKSLTAIYAANNKVFDGNTTATLASAALQDKIAGDVVTPTNTSATFDTAAVGTDKTVTVAGIKLTGKDAANYALTNTTATTKANITASPVKPPSPVVPTDSTPRVKIPVGSANPFALASAEDLTDEACTANSIENCYCEPSELNKHVDICYEPKAGAKGTAH